MTTDAEMLATAAFSSPVKHSAKRTERKHAQRKAMVERGDFSQLRREGSDRFIPSRGSSGPKPRAQTLTTVAP